MAQQVTLPQNSLANLVCGLCKRLLSVPPIRFSQGKYVCGRCNPSLGRTVPIYEELAQFMIFPCTFENCKDELPWGKVLDHEKQCLYKTLLCPFYLCDKRYEMRMLGSHFEVCHEKHKHINQYKSRVVRLKDVPVSKTEADKSVSLVMFKDKPYLVFVRSYGDIRNIYLRYNYEFAVFAFNEKPNTNIKYDVTLEVKSTVHTKSPTKRYQEITQFNEQVHCLNCLDNDCSSKNHMKTDNFFRTKFDDLESNNNTHVEYSVTIYDAQDKHPGGETEGSNLAEKLECPICNNYMCAPIYNCAKGHSLCGECHSVIDTCPFCRSQMDDSRNYILEEIAGSMKIPCHNFDTGCGFLGVVKDVKKHEVDCAFN